MTQKDKELIDQAQKLTRYDFSGVWALMEKAETPAARLVLEKIACRKYHMEEAKVGMI